MKLKIFASFLVSLMLTACEPVINNYPWQHFNDNIIMIEECEDYGVAHGQIGIKQTVYLYYGEIKGGASGRIYTAGTAHNLTELYNYPILELLKKYPQCRNERSVKAAAIQLQFITKHHPAFQNPADYAGMGHHGQ